MSLLTENEHLPTPAKTSVLPKSTDNLFYVNKFPAYMSFLQKVSSSFITLYFLMTPKKRCSITEWPEEDNAQLTIANILMHLDW